MPVDRATALITPLVTVSSLGHPFIVISEGGFVDGVPGIAVGGGARDTDEVAAAARLFVQSFHSGAAPCGGSEGGAGAAVLADFEGEMPGWGGELRCAQFMLTTAVSGTTRDPRSTRTAVPGLLLDLGTGLGVELCRQVMEEAALAKLIWGADGDLTSLRHQGGLGTIRSKCVIDVQLGYSTEGRRLGMERMLNTVPGSFLSGLPSKGGHITFGARRQNRRCLRWPLSRALACYAMDDLHRIEAILLSQEPTTGDFRGAQVTTATVIASIETPADAVREVEKKLSYYHRKSGEGKAINAVEFARRIKHIEQVFGADARLDKGLRTRLANVLRVVAPVLATTSVIIPEDLAFAP
jgi:hypothetical protein